MAASLAVKRGTIGVATVLNKLLNPLRSVSAVPSVQRCFNTNSSQMTAYDDDNRGVDVDRRADTTVSRRRDNDLFSGVSLLPVTRCLFFYLIVLVAYLK